MFVDFKELSPLSRIWIFQSNRSFLVQELEQLTKQIQEYIEQWLSHSIPIRASFELRYRRFIIIAIDENQHIGGCSIDNMVRFIQKLEEQYQVILLDKMNVSFKQGEYITYKPLNEFKKMVQLKSVSAQTIVFNNLVNTIEEYQSHWEVPLSESWHARFLNK